MKYLILLCDGMADLPVPELGNLTPMEVADKKTMDMLARQAFTGIVQTVPPGISPGSDTANMAVMGYEPVKYYTGRSPIEAISMGIDMKESDVAFRVNLVTLSDNETDDDNYSEKTMIDYSSDEITTEEAAILIESVNKHFKSENINFYPGKSYRHCMIWDNGPLLGTLTPPHDILTQKISEYLPKSKEFEPVLEMMKESYKFLKNHPINLKRIKNNLRPANSIWIWGQGKKPSLPAVSDIYGLKGSVVAAVDLIFGLAICSGLKPVEVEGATGNIHTNFHGKAMAAINEFEEGQDYVYLHIEAPDECGHRNEVSNKVLSIELIDKKVLTPIYEYFCEKKKRTGEDFRILILPDHPTPLTLRTHTSDPVPFVLYSSDNKMFKPSEMYTEKICAEKGAYFESGSSLFEFFIKS